MCWFVFVPLVVCVFSLGCDYLSFLLVIFRQLSFQICFFLSHNTCPAFIHRAIITTNYFNKLSSKFVCAVPNRIFTVSVSFVWPFKWLSVNIMRWLCLCDINDRRSVISVLRFRIRCWPTQMCTIQWEQRRLFCVQGKNIIMLAIMQNRESALAL